MFHVGFVLYEYIRTITLHQRLIDKWLKCQPNGNIHHRQFFMQTDSYREKDKYGRGYATL